MAARASAEMRHENGEAEEAAQERTERLEQEQEREQEMMKEARLALLPPLPVRMKHYGMEFLLHPATVELMDPGENVLDRAPEPRSDHPEAADPLTALLEGRELIVEDNVYVVQGNDSGLVESLRRKTRAERVFSIDVGQSVSFLLNMELAARPAKEVFVVFSGSESNEHEIKQPIIGAGTVYIFTELPAGGMTKSALKNG